MSNDLEDIRIALQDQQDQVDQNDQRIFEDLLSSKSELNERIEKLLRKIDGVNDRVSEVQLNFSKYERTNEENIGKTQENMTQQEQKILDLIE